MNRLIIIAIGLLSCINSWGIQMLKDLTWKDGKERTHLIQNWEDAQKLGLDITKKWWAIPNDSTIQYVNMDQFLGIIRNDIKLFCQDTEFEGMSSLYLEVEPYASRIKPYVDNLSKLRAQVLSDTLYANCEKNWKFLLEDYDTEKRGFYINLQFDPIYHGKYYPIGRKETIYGLKSDLLYIDGDYENLTTPFEVAKAHYGEQWNYQSIFVPFKNINLAIKMIEPENVKKEFTMMYEYKIVLDKENQSPSYLITDLLLIYDPTGQVVWSATTGDHSDEVTL